MKCDGSKSEPSIHPFMSKVRFSASSVQYWQGESPALKVTTKFLDILEHAFNFELSCSIFLILIKADFSTVLGFVLV